MITSLCPSRRSPGCRKYREWRGECRSARIPDCRTSFPLPRWRCTDQGPEGHRPRRWRYPAVIALFLGQGQDEHQGEPHGGQGGDQRQEHIPPCLHFIGQLPVHEVHAIGAEGLEEHQQNEKGGQVQRIADGPQKQEYQRRDNRKADKRQTQNAGLVFVLLRSGKFHHGVGQGRLGLQCGCNGENADPHIIIGDISVAAGAPEAGKTAGP